jgi:ATP synthase protein I
VSQSLALGRRLARKAALLQLAAGALTAAITGPVWGLAAAAGVLSGAAAAALGTATMARVALGGGIQPASVIYLRMVGGMLLKWLLVGLLLYLALARWRFPPLAVLSGLALAMLVFPLAHLSGSKQKTKTQGDE